MKYMQRAQIYKANNVTFNPKTCEAHSYAWWRFVAKVDGVVIFNNFGYSNSTRKHQSKVRSLLNDLGIKVDIVAPFPQGIKNESLESLVLQAEENLCDMFLSEESKRIERNEKAAKRRAIKKSEADARFKADMDSPEFAQAAQEFIAQRGGQ